MALLDRLNAELTTSQAGGLSEGDLPLPVCVCQHLNRLLSARRGSVPHLPGYGLIDIEEIFQGLPYTQQQFADAIVVLIQAFEPRVRHVLVEPVKTQEMHWVVGFRLQLYLVAGGQLDLLAGFSPGGLVDIRRMQRGTG